MRRLFVGVIKLVSCDKSYLALSTEAKDNLNNNNIKRVFENNTLGLIKL